MRDPTLLVLCIAITLTFAQLATEIGDGQIQAPTSPIPSPIPTPPPPPAEAPRVAIASPTAPPPFRPAEHAIISPPPQPAPIIPAPAPKEEATTAPPSPVTAKISITHTFSNSTCTGTAALVPAGNNATAPTVPAAPSVVNAAPTEEGSPKEAVTTVPVLAQATGGTRRGREVWGGWVGVAGIVGVVAGVKMVLW